MLETTVQQTFESALQFYASRQLPEAEDLCRQILSQQPQHLDAMHLLAIIARQQGKTQIAVDSLRSAIALKPDWPEALNSLGNALNDQGRLEESIAAYRRAIVLAPNYQDAHYNLGNALQSRGRLDEAIAAFRQAIAISPNFAVAHCNLGNALMEKGDLDGAISAFETAIALNPGIATAHSNLGNALRDKGKLGESITACRQATVLDPNLAPAHNNLGNAQRDSGQLDEALASYRRAIALNPGYPEAHNNLGNALEETGQLEQAILAYQQAIALRPAYAEARNNLGSALKSARRIDESIVAFKDAIGLRPNFAEAYSNLGSVQKEAGNLDAAVVAFRQSLVLQPNNAAAHSNLIFTLEYHPGYDSAAIAAEQRRWEAQHAQPLKKLIQPHANDRNPQRQLRIGYVSSDFREHVVGRNIMPLLSHHDHRLFEITCYAQVSFPDAATHRFQQFSDRWRNTVGISDDQLADQIREDAIDILVDLSLHSSGNRLKVFARKPAPIAVTFAGYPGSTGLGAIDYRLSDPCLDPPGMDETIYSEKTVRLPNSFWCYDPTNASGDSAGESGLTVNSLPALSAGRFTFGCLNNFCKINEAVLEIWASVLQRVPNSRLLLLAPQGSHRGYLLSPFSAAGIDPTRIEFAGHRSRRAYLELYHQIDLGLDTWPYNGHSTSLDALWMGVPVITLIGSKPAARAGWCQLSNLRLTDLAATVPEDFVKIAAGLSQDLPRLAQLRSTLRQRMEGSPLMDQTRYARDVETAFRNIWIEWCKRG